MHKIRRLLLSLLLFPLALISCSSGRVYGHYAFQMGSDKSTHFGVYTDLLDEDVYVPKDPEDPQSEKIYKGKKFKFGMRVSEDIMPDPTVEPTIDKIFLWLFLLLTNTEADPDAYLQGYYTIGDKEVENFGKRIHMTITIDPDIFPIELPEEIAEKFMIAYVNKNSIKFIMPVSLDDIRCQFCWYGLFMHIYTYNYTDDEGNIQTGYDSVVDPLCERPEWAELGYPDEEHLNERVGTHPTQYDIDMMNEKFTGVFHQTVTPPKAKDPISIDCPFRDYNSLTIDLLKD